jgi:hypothetical protein
MAIELTADDIARVTHHFRARLPMWVVYRPSNHDYPGLWVMRMHITLPEPSATSLVVAHEDLEALHELIPEWLTNLGRAAGDDVYIEEVWL